MVRAIFDELGKPQPKNHFTIGIVDDITHTSLPFDPDLVSKPTMLYARSSLVWEPTGQSAPNMKNSIKIIGTETDHFAQGYFVYDSKSPRSMTISHLRFGPARFGPLPDPLGEPGGVSPFPFSRKAGCARMFAARRGLSAELFIRRG